MYTSFSILRRAARASAALRGTPTNGRPSAYYDHSKRDEWSQIPEEGVVYLLADIRHFCDLLNLDFNQLDTDAYRHYSDEIDKPIKSKPKTILRQACGCSRPHSDAAGVVEACIQGQLEGSDETWTGF